MSQNFWQCCKSIFSFHNETMNIWTHLIALFVLWAASITLAYEYYINSDEVSKPTAIFVYIPARQLDFMLSVL